MKFKNIQTVYPINQYNSLAEVFCTHEDLKHNTRKYEVFYINKSGEIVAYFENKTPFWVEPLHNNRSDLFVINWLEEKRRCNIVQVKCGVYKLLNTYEDIEYGIEDGCFAVKKDGLWGFINEEAEEVIPCEYEDYSSFAFGLAAVCKNSKCGFINKQNEVVIPFIYSIPQFTSFNGEFAPVFQNNKYGYIDKAGNTIIPLEYENAEILYPNSKIFPVKLNNKWGFIDINQNIIIPFEYDEVECNGDNFSLYTISKDSSLGIIDPIKGKVIVPCEYKTLCVNKNSICAEVLTESGHQKFGLLDWNGNIIVDFKYNKMSEYSSEGLYRAQVDKKWGFIDESGRTVIAFLYARVDDFCGGYSLARTLEGQKLVINKFGQKVLGPQNDIYNLGDGMFMVENDDYEYELIKRGKCK